MPFTLYHNILLIGIDDDPDDLDRISDILDSIKFKNRVLTTKKEEFLERASKAMVNMCLIDNRLGKDTGLDVIRQLSLISEHNYIIVFSEMDGSAGKPDFDRLVEYINSGAHKFLKKNDKQFEEKLISYLQEGFLEAQKRIDLLEAQKAKAMDLWEKAKKTDELVEKLTK